MASLQRKVDDKLQCLLCPHFCKLAEDRTGICGVRKNTGEKIELITYGVISGYSLDPVEKKPLYHFFPGNNILSIGSYGCNMRCDFCQNFHISQKVPESHLLHTTPEHIVSDSKSLENNIGVAFTYNEPIISFEFMRDTATLAKEAGLFTVMVSNGFVNSEPLNEIIQFIDAFNIDLKAFNNDFYRNITGSELGPVKNSLKQISKAEKHLEITTLIIPGQNDDEKEMAQQVEWIAEELGKGTPFHLSRYFPIYRRKDPSTSDEKMARLFEIASEKLNYVYLGNTMSKKGQSTRCPECGTEVTTRKGYKTQFTNLDNDGNCSTCGNTIYRYFTFSSKIVH